MLNHAAVCVLYCGFATRARPCAGARAPDLRSACTTVDRAASGRPAACTRHSTRGLLQWAISILRADADGQERLAIRVKLHLRR